MNHWHLLSQEEFWMYGTVQNKNPVWTLNVIILQCLLLHCQRVIFSNDYIQSYHHFSLISCRGTEGCLVSSCGLKYTLGVLSPIGSIFSPGLGWSVIRQGNPKRFKLALKIWSKQQCISVRQTMTPCTILKYSVATEVIKIEFTPPKWKSASVDFQLTLVATKSHKSHTQMKK